jgi:hypothetical protein
MVIVVNDRSVPEQFTMNEKLNWRGTLLAIQPRIRLMRSFDQRSHSYLGYVLHMRGTIADEERDFSVGIGQAAQSKHKFQTGDTLSGRAEPVADPRLEPVEFYKASALKIIERAGEQGFSPPPWLGVPPELPVYRERGHRRLDAKTFTARCSTCIWGCRMPVEMIIDQWNPSQKKYRFETFCYGPKSCSLYRAGPTRKVPGRKGMSWEEEDWIDEEATAHRGDDE